MLTTIAAGLAAAFVLLVVRPDLLQLGEPGEPAVIKQVVEPPQANRRQGPVSYADAVESALPSVVNIYAAKVTTERQTLMFKDPVLQHLFGRLLPEQTRKRLKTSLGSGVIVSKKGYILTNYHVIKGADEIRVVISNGHNLTVTVVGVDPETDLAVLKAGESGALSAITLGDSGHLRVGDVVLAIGNPFGVGQTVTMGIVSATGRSDLGINTYENFIQTDAAINPGNSGGALINALGQLVGINTAIFSKSGGSQGIGFAIPVNLATGVMKQLIEHGRVVRGWIGISGQNVTPELAESFGLQTAKGVLVSSTLENGPADKAGIRPGDVILTVNGHPANDMHELLDLISSAGPNKKLEIELLRGDEKVNVLAVTAERPAMTRKRLPAPPPQ